MTDVQRADFEAGKRSLKFNADNSLVIATIDDETRAPIIAGIIDQMKKVGDAEAAQQYDAGDLAGAKELAKINMGKIVIRYSLRGELKAGQIGNIDLKTALERPISYITDVDDVLSVAHAKGMRGTLDANKGPLGLLTNITAGDIVIIDAAIKGFTDIETSPTDNIKEKKAQGTDKMQPEIDLLMGWIDSERKLFHSYWEDTDKSSLMDEFDLKSEPIVLGKRHNIAEVTLVKDEDGSELTGGLVTCVKNGKTSDGNFTNVYTIVSIPAGVQPFKAEAAGRVMVEFELSIKRRTTTGIVVRMKLV